MIALHHRRLAGALALCAIAPMAHAMERITLRTGFVLDCVRHEAIDGKVRLYLQPATPGADANYLDVAPTAILQVETIPDPPPTPRPVVEIAAAPAEPTPNEIGQILASAGNDYNIDAELLASVVHAESGGNVHAVSRAGAQGLMQLMPGTAAEIGVKDAFVAAQNVQGGTKYLDTLLKKYHDNIALALAAYNAGPAAVDRYRGIPPFRETRAYVSRVIREFNRRKTEALARNKQAH